MQREGLQTVRWMQFTYFNRNGYTTLHWHAHELALVGARDASPHMLREITTRI